MRRRLAAFVTFVLVAGDASHAQTLNPSPRDVINLTRTLTEAEVAAVLNASRYAVDGRTFRMSYQPGGLGPEIQMGPDGRPRYIRMTSGSDVFTSWSATNGGPAVATSRRRNVTTFLHYTRTVARDCDGTPRGGELVLAYENEGKGWTVKARTRTAMEINGAAFDMLAGNGAVTTGLVQRVGDRSARPFIAPFKLPEGAMGGPPPGTMMSLWLDTEWLLPVRWSLTIPASPELGIPVAVPDFGVVFTYLESVDLHPPTEVSPPDCIR